MSRWNVFIMGTMAGIIVVLFCALFMQNSPQAYGQSAMADSGGGILGGTGGVLSGANDIFWVLHKRVPSESEKKLLGQKFEGERITLSCYRVLSGGGPSGQGRMILVAARDVTYDLKLTALDQETTKSVKDIRKAYEDALKKADEK